MTFAETRGGEYGLLFRRVFDKVESILKNAPGCHDFDHTLRVFANAEKIAAGELARSDARSWMIVELGAILHDVARPEELASGGRICHAAAGGDKAAAILRAAGCSDETLAGAVKLCVERHRYRAKAQPVTLPEKIVYDADKLDSIGAVGVGRAFHFAGRTGARLHNTAAEALGGEAYGREDSAFREYLVKLKYISSKMLTETGRNMASARAKFMDDFFIELNAESEDAFRLAEKNKECLK